MRTAHVTTRRDPQPTPTTVDASRPSATVPESDPATALVRKGDFVELPPGSVVDDVYEVDARLGAGAMGEVYAAHHVKLGKRVAIKVIAPHLSEDAGAIERFAQEARSLAQVQHPAIVAVDHVGELADGRAYFVMELLRGEVLFDRLQRGRIALPEALRVLDQVARGLDAAHGEGVVHRDLKPENIFLVHLPGEPPAVKLVDFGLAKLRSDADRRAERTASGATIGTPMYMSPEQMRGEHVDHRTDVYALGAVAYELLLGQPLFPRARTAPEFYAAHLHQSPPLPRSIWPEVPPQLDLVLFAMVAKDPAHRPTLAQVRAVVAAVQSDLQDTRRAQTVLVAPRPASAKVAATAVLAAIMLVVGIAIGAALSRTPSPNRAPFPLDAGMSIAPITSLQAPTPAPPPSPTQVAPIAPIADAPAPPPKRHRPPAIESGSARSAIAPADAGVNAAVRPPQPPPPPPPRSGRDRTINPFEHKGNP